MTVHNAALGYATRWAMLWLVAALSAIAAPARADHLKLGNEGVYPPFSMVDESGTLKGIEPDWAREMCKRMNADCEFVVMDFKALIPSLLQGKFDALVSQINPLPERKAKALKGANGRKPAGKAKARTSGKARSARP